MGLEIIRKKDKTLKSKWWYGRFEVNGKKRSTNLGIEIKGKIPPTLRQNGDATFERSRAQAQVALDNFMKDARSRIIYIGKAVDLRSRVGSYFQKNADSRVFYEHITRRVADVECMVTASEAEALILGSPLRNNH